MLVLSRKKGEKIYIGDLVVLTVLGIVNGKVRLVWEAPKEVKIIRAELGKTQDGEQKRPA